eukprot:m.25932 g.25932  ORF g.25932 m.25932 type:complete len:98 (+) comp29021_c0_seq1:766-1059(+)
MTPFRKASLPCVSLSLRIRMNPLPPSSRLKTAVPEVILLSLIYGSEFKIRKETFEEVDIAVYRLEDEITAMKNDPGKNLNILRKSNANLLIKSLKQQ